LFGSVLTDKPNPADVDLLCYALLRPEFVNEAAAALVSGRRGPIHRAISELRRGMKMVSIHDVGEEGPDGWFRARGLDPGPTRLIWERGMDWCKVLDDVEAHPPAWDPAVEARNKADKKIRCQGEELERVLRKGAGELGVTRLIILSTCAQDMWSELATGFFEKAGQTIADDLFDRWVESVQSLIPRCEALELGGDRDELSLAIAELVQQAAEETFRRTDEEQEG
jgi:hypothetical protein